MPKKAKELSAVEVRRLKTPGQYAVGGVPGLSLRVGEGAAKSWVLRYMDGSRRSEMGLGAFPEVELAQARGKAKVARDSLRAGTRPVPLHQARDDINAGSMIDPVPTNDHDLAYRG